MEKSINNEEQFWKYIADDINDKYTLGHPSRWNTGIINRFRAKMEEELLKACDEDQTLLGIIIPNYSGKKNASAQIKIPNVKVFKDKFQGGEMGSKEYTKNMFSLLFGYRGHLVYLNDRDSGVDDFKDTSEKSLSAKIIEFNKNQLGFIDSLNEQYHLEKIFIKPILKDRQQKIWSPNLETLIKVNQRIIIHSESFTGKTTLLKYLALKSSKDKYVLFLPLSEYRGSIEVLAQERYGLSATEAKSLIFRNPKTILLLDAFDEITTDQLRTQLLSIELKEKNIYNYIMTSRSSFLVNKQIPATLKLKVDLYDIDSIYFMVDAVLEQTSKVTEFHTNLRYGIKVNKNLEILKYPWLVIFVIEYFKDGNELNHDFYLTLPIEHI